jgi:Spy/CpxP family protein refolding chaperone
MALESDTLADTARRFSEAIRAERQSTLEALAAERQAVVEIIKTLRQETARRRKAASGRFIFGMLLGATAGALMVYFANQRASEETRLGLTAHRATLADRFKQALDAGRQAARSRQEELWERYRRKVSEALQPPPPEPEEPLF